MLQLEEKLNQERFTQLSLEEQHLLNRMVKFGRSVASIYRFLCLQVVIFYAVYPFFDSRNADGSRKLPLPMQFPFNANNYYYEVYCISMLSLSIGAWTNSNIDILTIMLITLGTAQMEVLKMRLEKVIPQGKNVPDGIIQGNLKECAEHLNYIYE